MLSLSLRANTPLINFPLLTHFSPTLLCTPTGPLPADLARLPNLAFLDLSHNTLSGNLHAFATALPPTNNILQINLAHNRLDGEVPATLQQLAAVRPVRVTMRDGCVCSRLLLLWCGAQLRCSLGCCVSKPPIAASKQSCRGVGDSPCCTSCCAVSFTGTLP